MTMRAINGMRGTEKGRSVGDEASVRDVNHSECCLYSYYGIELVVDASSMPYLIVSARDARREPHE